MNKKYFLLTLLFITALLSLRINAQLLDKNTLSLGLAKKMADVAESAAIKNNITVVVAIVDDGGNLIYLERMDNTQLGSIEVATKKAHTSAFFRRSSKSFEDRVAGGINSVLSIPNVLPFEGGLPIFFEKQLIGAVGISGGSPQQDGIVAKAVVDYFESLKLE